MKFLVALIAACACAGDLPDPLTAAAIMSRVAANQDRVVEARKAWIYVQRVRIETHRPNGSLVRREIATYNITPGDKSSTRTLASLDGCHWHDGKWVEFHGTTPALPDSIDAQIISEFRNDLTDDKSKDGLGRDLFPLTTAQQNKHTFRLLGEQSVHGRKAWRIAFRPADKSDFTWAGEALIDEQDFEPLNVFTKLSRRIPFAVRTLLGTDVPGLGFNVNYARFSDGAWFPTSFGTEFRLHAVFFLNREITLSLDNSGFHHADVDSRIIDYR